MKKGFTKQGLSPVVATILLIFMVLVIAGIIFLWASGFFTEQLEKNSESVENQCAKVDIEVDLPEGYGGSSAVTIDIVNNGNVGIYGVSVKESGGPNSEAHFILLNLNPGEGQRFEATLQNSVNLDEIIVYPVLLGTVVGGADNKQYTCTQNPQRFKLKPAS